MLCRDAGDTGNLPLALEGVAATAAARHAWLPAGRMLGAAEAARRTEGQPTIPVYEQLYAATAATVLQALGQKAFLRAWETGHRLGVDDAVAEAQTLAAAGFTSAAHSAGRGPRLSAREQEILGLLANGHTSREIAAALFLSSHTVERHVANLYAKIGARRRADAVAYALQHGMLAPSVD
jgi:DNA-binding CsgD family transcriptional regulator